MIKALQLIFSPFETWEKITTSQRGFVWTFFVQLLPLVVVCVGIEGFLLNRWGEKRGDFGFVIKVPLELALRYAAAYIVILLAAVFVSAKFLGMASESFNVRTTYFQSFVVMAYGYAPIILARILDGFPQLNTWVCWVLGVAASVSILYQGVGMVLRPDQTKGFGLYLISTIIVVLISGLGHFAALSVLHGKMLQQHTALFELFYDGRTQGLDPKEALHFSPGNCDLDNSAGAGNPIARGRPWTAANIVAPKKLVLPTG